MVSVTTPDGEVEKFRAKASPECTAGNGILDVDLVFEPIDNARGSLRPLNDIGGRLINNGWRWMLAVDSIGWR